MKQLVLCLTAVLFIRGVAAAAGATLTKGSTANCTQRVFDVEVDHFSWRATKAPLEKLPMRVFMFDGFWESKARTGPIWFYTGKQKSTSLCVCTGMV